MIDQETRDQWRRDAATLHLGMPQHLPPDRIPRLLDMLDLADSVHRDTTAERDEAEARAQRAERTISRQLGECIGCTTEPDEFCPIDGRSITEWQEIALEVYRERTEAVETLARVRVLAEEYRANQQGYHADAIDAALRGDT